MIVSILDYGAGNLRNVCRAIQALGREYEIVSTPAELSEVAKLIIPGVGAFKNAMKRLEVLNLLYSINRLATKGVPIMGICLGMQILLEKSSEFGLTKGLGLLKGCVNEIPAIDTSGAKLKVPHVGWNELVIGDSNSRITKNIIEGSSVYFVHSFRAEEMEAGDLVAHCVYGGFDIPSIVENDNIFGCQFHPEKSGTVGLTVLDNFLRNI